MNEKSTTGTGWAVTQALLTFPSGYPAVLSQPFKGRQIAGKLNPIISVNCQLVACSTEMEGGKSGSWLIVRLVKWVI